MAQYIGVILFGGACISVGLFVSSLSRNQIISLLVKMSDLFATLADIYGFPILQEFTDGLSLLPLLIDPNREINARIIIERLGSDA